MTTPKFSPDGAGGFRTADGRWTVRPVTMAAGGRGWPNERWQITDTTEQARLSKSGTSHTRICRTLSEAREIAIYHTKKGSA